MKFRLYNTAHPLAESGKPIFLPFGEWAYDSKLRQRLDRAHGEAIANELNARVARGEPGIPVYQGHPDVPDLAPKYPDKGAIGWVERIAIANEGGRDGLALTVNWDRDPGRGFKWFSPYWFGMKNEGGVIPVESIKSIGLVNTPNIEEFRLPNESAEDNEKGKTMNIEELKKLLGLPPEATEEQVKAAIAAGKDATEKAAAEKAKAEAAGKDAETKVAAANAEAEEAKKETAAVKTELANERAAHRGLLLDQAVAEGRISVAGRAAWEKRLSEDFAAGKVALANEKPMKTHSAVDGAQPKTASDVNLVALANEKMTKNPGMTYMAAFAAVMKEHPEVK